MDGSTACRVRRLSLRCAQSAEQGAVLAIALRAAPALEALALKGRLPPSALRALADAASACPRLSALTLESVGLEDPFEAESVFASLRAAPALEALCLAGNRLGDAGAAALARALLQPRHGLGGLLELDLRRTRCGGKGAARLWEALESPRLPLRRLLLGSNGLGCVEGQLELGLAVKGSATLACLDLSHCGMHAENVRQLARALWDNASLSQLVLRGNRVGNEGARLFGRALGANAGLQLLDLGDNGIDGAGAQALAAAVVANVGLRHLALEGNAIGEEGAAALDKARGARLTLYL